MRCWNSSLPIIVLFNVVMMTIPVFMLAKKVKVNSERMKRHWRISLYADSVFI